MDLDINDRKCGVHITPFNSWGIQFINREFAQYTILSMPNSRAEQRISVQ
jgi:subtilisin-like proprotein convertase family protein